MKKLRPNQITVTGDGGNNTLNGTGGSDLLQGLGGNDILNGGGGADITQGGIGDDFHYVDNAGDVVEEAAGEGNDRVFASVSYTLAAGAEVETLSTTNHVGTTAINLTGSGFANVIHGNDGNNVLDGKAGADTLVGRLGNDFYYVDNGLDRVVESAGQGNDRVFTSVSYTLGAGVSAEMFTTTLNTGTSAINLTGNELVNIIYGNDGANTLDGKAGADTLVGRLGNDFFYVDHAADRTVEAAGEGNDRVFASVSYTLAAGESVETLTTTNNTGTGAINLTGNELANVIYGNDGANILNGGGGADALIGWLGDDFFYVDTAADQVTETAGQGNDRVFASASYALAAGASVEMLTTTLNTGTTAINLTGNELANTMFGNDGVNTLNGGGGSDGLVGLAGNDILNGGTGVDTSNGGAGDDWHYVDEAGDLVQEAAGEGNDRVFTSVSYTLGAGLSVETFTTTANGGTSAINLTGNELVNTIYGNDGANVIDGKGGNDTLVGLGGADSFAFTTALGAGNVDAVLNFAVGSDKIQLAGAAGQPFAALASGTLRAGTLVIGSAALDADDYLIYNSSTGALLYDADGNGAGAAVQFATLATGLGLTVGDFIVDGAANTAPAITSGTTASVAENSSAATIVYQTVANDAQGDRITYSLSGADAGLLTIDANGAVRLIAAANFEVKSSYSFNVVASDSGLANTKGVTLTITDVNENTPLINETASANDSIATAQVINPATLGIAINPNLPNDDYPSATIVGSISSLTDKDFFSITLQAGQRLVLDVDGTSGLDSFLTLYGPGGVFLAENDDLVSDDPGSDPPFGHNTDSQLFFRAATSGTYTFSIGSFEDDSQGNYQINVSIGPAASAAQIMAEDVDALISGERWNDTTLTYGFPTSASEYPQDFEEVSSSGPGDPVPTFEAFTATQIMATQSLLQLIANVTEFTFTQNVASGPYTTPGTAAAADLRFAESDEAEVAYAWYPTNAGPSDEGGSAWFNHDNFDTPVRGNYAWMGILHEIGHALGLKHGHEFPLAISADHDSVEYSVMTYRSYPGAPVGEEDGGYTNETWGYPQTLMMLDIAALQKIYDGANYAFNSGTSVYSWSTTTGELSINGVGQGAPGNGAGGSANRIFMTIWDGGGTDTYDLSNYSISVTIDLRPGEWTATGGGQFANLGDGHMARGNIANALLFEDDTRSAIENAIGGGGADVLIANQVANRLTGNANSDVFRWMTTGDAGTGSAADTVLDFVRGGDKIDFSNLDALPGTAGQQDFAFIGTGAFTNVAGQVRYDVTGGNAHILADVDGNGTADMQIILTGITTLAGTDFTF